MLAAILCLCTLWAHCATAAQDGDIEKTQTFAQATSVDIIGPLQHIAAYPAAGDALVIRWTGDGTETVTSADGHVSLAFAEPDWLDKERPGDRSPRFAAMSTIVLEIPARMEAITLTTTLGDITLEGLTSYCVLSAQTVSGNITVSGMVGKVSAQTGEGQIGPDAFATNVEEMPYSDEQTSKHLAVVLPGAGERMQDANLSTVLGTILINP